jgi:hypothetical protein
MTNQHPITPPPELVNQWCDEDPGGFEMFDRLATKAARWGADQELEACCQYISGKGEWFVHPGHRLAELRAARRPKPPTLKEQALAALLHLDHGQHNERCLIIRRALEQL